jgi:hypothetical protein
MATDPSTSPATAQPAAPQTPTPVVVSPAQPAPSPVQPPWDGNGGNEPKRPNRVHPKWTVWHTLSLLFIVVAIGALGGTQRPLVAFLTTLALMALFTTITGHGVVGLWRGLLIDERNKLSLSRLQLTLWTIIILSGFLTAALWNVANAPYGVNPLAIGIPQQMWLLMGISTTALVASPLILSTKKTEPADTRGTAQDARNEEEARMKADMKQQNIHPDAIGTQGKVVIWMWPEDSRLADLFQGDEIGNQAHLDLGKVQMFFFTLVLVFTYVVMLAHSFSQAAAIITEFPSLDQSMVALLGISHAGYLTNKAVPHSVG